MFQFIIRIIYFLEYIQIIMSLEEEVQHDVMNAIQEVCILETFLDHGIIMKGEKFIYFSFDIGIGLWLLVSVVNCCLGALFENIPSQLWYRRIIFGIILNSCNYQIDGVLISCFQDCLVGFHFLNV